MVAMITWTCIEDMSMLKEQGTDDDSLTSPSHQNSKQFSSIRHITFCPFSIFKKDEDIDKQLSLCIISKEKYRENINLRLYGAI